MWRSSSSASWCHVKVVFFFGNRWRADGIWSSNLVRLFAREFTSNRQDAAHGAANHPVTWHLSWILRDGAPHNVEMICQWHMNHSTHISVLMRIHASLEWNGQRSVCTMTDSDDASLLCLGLWTSLPRTRPHKLNAMLLNPCGETSIIPSPGPSSRRTCAGTPALVAAAGHLACSSSSYCYETACGPLAGTSWPDLSCLFGRNRPHARAARDFADNIVWDAFMNTCVYFVSWTRSVLRVCEFRVPRVTHLRWPFVAESEKREKLWSASSCKWSCNERLHNNKSELFMLVKLVADRLYDLCEDVLSLSGTTWNLCVVSNLRSFCYNCLHYSAVHLHLRQALTVFYINCEIYCEMPRVNRCLFWVQPKDLESKRTSETPWIMTAHNKMSVWRVACECGANRQR